MDVSLKCLSQFVDLSGLTPEDISTGLTYAGIEVEETRPLAYATKLCVGEIKECELIPETHLHICKIDLGSKYGVKQIVCGAPNARKGLKVCVALEGCELLGGKINHSVIRGYDSEGMCCSILELGIDKKYLKPEEYEGIIELGEDAEVGSEDVLSYLGLDDYVLSLSILANRPDLLSVINIAREVGAIFNRKVVVPTAKELATYKTDFTVSSMTSRCTQFAAKEIKGIDNKGESPQWLTRYLMAMGVRSISPVIDIGNYVMLLTGQPLHMYDRAKLKGHTLIAKDSYEGDFVALDEKTYKIIKGDICICSEDTPMCLGGVMGSLTCAVDSDTTSVVIESASFDGATIRHTSARLGLASESSSRFVKGTNHFQSEFVINLTSELLKQICGANEFSQRLSYQSETEKVHEISATYSDINSRLGTSFTSDEINSALTRLYFKVTSKKDSFVAVVPSFRLDISCWEDLSEEVGRLLGYDNIPSVLPSFEAAIGGVSPLQEKISLISDLLISKGLDRILTYTLLSAKEDAFTSFFDNDSYHIKYPLTDDHEVVRTSLSHSMLKAISYNISRQNKNLALFEISEITSRNSYKHHLCIGLANKKLEQSLLTTREYDFYDLKGHLEAIFHLLGIEGSRYKLEENKDVKELHPYRSALISVGGTRIGYLGEVHPSLLSRYELKNNKVLILEIELDALLNMKVSPSKMEKISRYPSVTHDLAFIVSKEVSISDLCKTIKANSNGLVIDTSVFDIYEGEGIAPGSKSVAISVTYASDTHTLEEKEVTLVEDNIKFELYKRHKAVLRG
ncbi:MAG: phenylalanine--tRNA ligase subunit beta [Coprobacillus sp.]|nr:phenylalanine--tRNA ligase subunit beta [Coprobacillus sp.]